MHAAELIIRALKKGALIPFRSEAERAFLQTWLAAEKGERPVKKKVEQDSMHGLSIKDKIRQCNRCAGVSERKFSFGTGENGVMIILHMPSKISAFEKKAFKADSLEMMRKMMKGIGLELEQCYITNMVKCESGAVNRPSDMFLQCEDLLKEEVVYAAPSVIIVMGSMGPLGRLAKSVESAAWFTIEHPLTLLKNPEMKRSAWETLKLAKAAIFSAGKQ